MNSKEKAELGREKAQKHIDLCFKTIEKMKKNLKMNQSDYQFFINTHPRSKIYKNLEKNQGEFWSIKLHSACKPTRKTSIKDPDIIVTTTDTNKKVLYFIEIKWGAIHGCKESDLKLSKDEFLKINSIEKGLLCRVRGPAVINHKRLDDKLKKPYDYCYNSKKVKFFLVSNFVDAKNLLDKEYHNRIVSILQQQKGKFILADINKRVDDIPSLQEIIGV